MIGLNINYYKNPVGQLNGQNNFHYPFRKTENDYFNFNHPSVNTIMNGTEPTLNHQYKIQNNHPTMVLNNLQNFNPNRLNKYEQKEIQRVIFNRDQRPLFGYDFNRKTDIVDEIDRIRKPVYPLKPFEHSMYLQPVK